MTIKTQTFYAPVKPVSSLNNRTKVAGEYKASSFIDLKDFPLKDYLLTQATIMGSVALEPNGYYIKKGYEPLVNLNGDCWPNDVTLATFHTYSGSYNFFNHVQVPEESKGWVLDCAVRPVVLRNGAISVYVDVLVATSRKHVTLCKQIEMGLINTVSLGAIVEESRCSRCGHISYTGNDYCEHLIYDRRKPFVDENGVTRITAEICGNAARPKTNRFIEVSWVGEPAFPGAVKNSIIRPVSNFSSPTGEAKIITVKPKDETSLLTVQAGYKF